jgi:hypothetical protein
MLDSTSFHLAPSSISRTEFKHAGDPVSVLVAVRAGLLLVVGILILGLTFGR